MRQDLGQEEYAIALGEKTVKFCRWLIIAIVTTVAAIIVLNMTGVLPN